MNTKSLYWIIVILSIILVFTLYSSNQRITELENKVDQRFSGVDSRLNYLERRGLQD